MPYISLHFRDLYKKARQIFQGRSNIRELGMPAIVEHGGILPLDGLLTFSEVFFLKLLWSPTVGNTVTLKDSNPGLRVYWEMILVFHKAGLPKIYLNIIVYYL